MLMILKMLQTYSDFTGQPNIHKRCINCQPLVPFSPTFYLFQGTNDDGDSVIASARFFLILGKRILNFHNTIQHTAKSDLQQSTLLCDSPADAAQLVNCYNDTLRSLLDHSFVSVRPHVRSC